MAIRDTINFVPMNFETLVSKFLGKYELPKLGGGRWVRRGWGGGMGRKCRQL